MENDIPKLIYEKRVSDVFSRIIAQEIEYYKAVIMMGQSAIKSSLFINAGALATAMVFFNANMKSIEDGVQEYVVLSTTLIYVMAIWLGNIVLCIMSYGFAYLSERRSYINYTKYTEELRHAVIESKNYTMPDDKASKWLGWVAWGCMGLSYAGFVISIKLCYEAFTVFIYNFR